MVYPYYSELQNLVSSMNRGNFSLWYNKFIPLNNFGACKACDQNGDDKNSVTHYCQQYNNTSKDLIAKLLHRKHIDLAQFCGSFSKKYETVVFKAKLQSPLITGIGESHPNEVSMVFDHNMGIPYIPASGIKGIVRFAHTLGLVDDLPDEMIKRDKDGNSFFDDEEDWTNIPELFGAQGKRGCLIFLDAYPEKVPELHLDIMNPHYGKYYSADQNETPPGDYLDPNPIKFLTVSKNTEFIFRALVDNKHVELIDHVKTAFRRALTLEGVGAKTAVGYGVFEALLEEESNSVLAFIKEENERQARKMEEAIAIAEDERRKGLTEDDIMVEEIAALGNDRSQIPPLVKKCLDGNFQRHVYEVLKEKLTTLGEWKPAGSRQRKQKMKNRNAKIEKKLG
jgi:CRISPR-associated protein Cmr6